jgi:hypothetical protein
MVARGVESEVRREYRHLLRTGSSDWQESAHRHALNVLGEQGRAEVLAECRRVLLSGTRLTTNDVHALARLVVLAERRRPRILLDGMRPEVLDALAGAVVDSPTGRMLRAGLDVWDGEDPPRPYEPPVPADHKQRLNGQWGIDPRGHYFPM